MDHFELSQLAEDLSDKFSEDLEKIFESFIFDLLKRLKEMSNRDSVPVFDVYVLFKSMLHVKKNQEAPIFSSLVSMAIRSGKIDFYSEINEEGVLVVHLLRLPSKELYSSKESEEQN